eukprot:861898-Pyramimonas_sp.AAC.1
MQQNNPYNNFNGDSPHHWRHHSREYRVEHPLFVIWGVSLASLALDRMHAMDLGCTGHSIANLFFEIVFEEADVPRVLRVERPWHRIQELYSEESVEHRLGSFMIGLFVVDLDAPP